MNRVSRTTLVRVVVGSTADVSSLQDSIPFRAYPGLTPRAFLLRRFAARIELEKGNSSARNLRGQVLVRMGREKEGRAELAAATRMLNQQRAARQKELEGETVPSPELAREPE